MGFTNINAITKQDLQDLIINKTQEDKVLEYKQELNISIDTDKKEFLADVSSFANASGGTIIYGLKERNGIPIELNGIDYAREELDWLKQRLSNMIVTGIHPRIDGIEMRELYIDDRIMFIIRIPKSWRGPHRVTIRGHNKFYARNTNGKYQMDTEDLRTAFLETESLMERILRFREERVAKIIADEGVVSLGDGGKIILHIVPYSFMFVQGNRASAKDIYKKTMQLRKIKPLGRCSEVTVRVNFEGVVLRDKHDNGGKGLSNSYVQIYKNGVIEAVDSSYLKMYKNSKLIPGEEYELNMVRNIKRYVHLLQKIAIPLPYIILLTYTGIKEYSMLVNHEDVKGGLEIYTIENEVLMVPEVIMHSRSSKIHNILKPSFDSLWNACGMLESPNYIQEGKFNNRKG